MAATQTPRATTPQRCVACGGERLRPVLTLDAVPAAGSVVFRSVQAARACATGRFDLQACEDCGLWFNAAFDPALVSYGEDYEETQVHSQVFRDYLDRLCRNLVRDHGLSARRVLEVGCGKGDFLARLCRLGDSTGTGFDPVFDPDRHPDRALGQAGGIGFQRRNFTTADAERGEWDAVVCRMTLEHVPEVAGFLAMLRLALARARAPLLYLQVPNFDAILDRARVCDLIYEHCNYFTPAALRRILEGTGFSIVDTRIEYDGQHLSVVARPAPSPPQAEAVPSRNPSRDPSRDPSRGPDIEARAAAFTAARTRWRGTLAALRAEGRRVALWGSGSRATTFLALHDAGPEVVGVIDINPYRDGSFVAGCGLPVVAPQGLKDPASPVCDADVVIAMNPVYRDEIAASLAALGVGATLLALE